MPAEKKDRRNGADSASAGYPKIFSRQRCLLYRWAVINQLSALFPGQSLAGRLRAYNLARTSEFAIRPVCCWSWLIQRLASRSRAVAHDRGAAALLSTSDEYKAAGLVESERGLRWPAE